MDTSSAGESDASLSTRATAEPVIQESSGDPRELDRFWSALRRLPRYLRLVANLARDRDVPRSAKAILALGGVYAISPVDLVPGIIPVAGQLDDLLVLLLALRLATRACPAGVAEAHFSRVGLAASDFDHDLNAARDTALWLARQGARGSGRLAAQGGRRVERLWRKRLHST